jgi:hypothetical protein
LRCVLLASQGCRVRTCLAGPGMIDVDGGNCFDVLNFDGLELHSSGSLVMLRDAGRSTRLRHSAEPISRRAVGL